MFCSICKSVSDLTKWKLGKEDGYICGNCLLDLKHFIDDICDDKQVRVSDIWFRLEHGSLNDIMSAVDELDDLPRTEETVERLRQLNIPNVYLQRDIEDFIMSIEDDL